MPRNFFRRVEVMFPVEDANLKKHLRDDVLLLALKDNVKARLLQKDGVYRRARKNAKTKPVRLQQVLMEKHSASHSEMPVGEIPVLEARPAAAPGSTPGVMLRAAPDLAPPAADGRAGTSADPILLSLRETLREQDENTPLENTPLESEAQNSEENADNIKLRLKKKARER
jgi:polyphosphate kinase